jgi:hypothetical protein
MLGFFEQGVCHRQKAELKEVGIGGDDFGHAVLAHQAAVWMS